MEQKERTKNNQAQMSRRRSNGWMFRAALRDERGTSLLEMAFLIPILLLLLLGIIEIGRYAELSILVANAARAGVQYGAQNLVTAADNAGIQNAALNDGQNISPCTGGNTTNCLTVSPPANAYSGYVLCGCSSSGTAPGSTCPPTGCSLPNHQLVYIQVDTQGKFKSLFSYPGIPSSLTINGSAQMRVAQ